MTVLAWVSLACLVSGALLVLSAAIAMVGAWLSRLPAAINPAPDIAPEAARCPCAGGRGPVCDWCYPRRGSSPTPPPLTTPGRGGRGRLILVP